MFVKNTSEACPKIQSHVKQCVAKCAQNHEQKKWLRKYLHFQKVAILHENGKFTNKKENICNTPVKNENVCNKFPRNVDNDGLSMLNLKRDLK